MDNIVQDVVKSRVKDAIGIKDDTKDESGINWAEYNFPPCIHLVHFSISELKGPVKRFVLCIYLSFITVITVLIINSKFFITNSSLNNNPNFQVHFRY